MEASRGRSVWPRGWLLAALMALLVAAGCGGGGGGGGGTSEPGTDTASAGRVAVFLTDGAGSGLAAKAASAGKESLEEYSQVLVTITEVELLGAGDAVSLYGGPPRVVDLLDLRAASLLLCMREVPAGTYDKIRLTATQIELVEEDGDSEIVEPLANGKIDLNPRDPFTVRPGETLVVELDAENSLHIVETGSDKIQFRPEVFVSVRPVPLPWPVGRLVRLQGTVVAFSAPAAPERWFLLEPSGRGPGPGTEEPCLVKVALGPEASFFDDEEIEIEFADLEVGDPVTAVGRFLPPAEVADEALLPVFGADLVERGTFLRLAGTVLTTPGPVPGTFLFRLDPGQGFRGDLVVDAHLYEGTKVYGPNGEPATLGDLTLWPGMPPVRARLDAVLTLSDSFPDVAHVALIQLEDRPNALARLSGTVISFEEGTDPCTGLLKLLVPAAVPGGVDLLVEIAVADGSHLYRLAPGPSLEPATVADLAPGAEVLVFARPDAAGDLVADDVFVTALAPAPL